VGKNHQFWLVRTHPKQVCLPELEPETSYFLFKELNEPGTGFPDLLLCGASTKTKDAFFERTGHGNCGVYMRFTSN
jgi:hypothetical protein